MSDRTPILYLAPWVGYGGSDKNTIDWFRWIDRDRFAPSLIVTQPSSNPLMDEVAPFAEEIWVLPDLMAAEKMPAFVFDFLQSRKIEVLHLMNSRLGFDLLPDLGCLPNPPAVVVQLHVEEVDRSGYVRYVSTRYGNLVDRFSISNEHVAEAVRGYGVPDDKIDVIYTGADAEGEFSPERATATEELPDDRLQILFPARLVDQKDPLLMVGVAADLRDKGVSFQIQVVGDGELEAQVKERVSELDLGEQVRFHPPTPGLQGWYAACDTLLLTSKFEGVPCVLFEAMAMGLPIVAPALPGIRELLHEDGDGLVEQRDSAGAYVASLSRLAADRGHRDAVGSEMRKRAQQHFSVQQMAASHGRIYEELTGARPRPELPGPAPLPELMRFIDRPVVGDQLVSVLIPHFNQLRFLGECLGSINAQTYPNLEVVVVDDASTERGLGAALDEFETADNVTVIRLAENGGPSRARNLGLEHCSGRYVLPVDSDNLLLPDAVEKLVDQLCAAGEEIGFIYPNLQFFGNREEYYEAPEYNLYTLLNGNFCDTCSLIDRQVFDAGIRYDESIKLGHEDWEFALRLAAHGIRGEVAREATVRYRKWGFNRSDIVDHAPDHFQKDVLAKISPFKGMEAKIKAKESPALSIVALGPAEPGSDQERELPERLGEQRCTDFELLPVGSLAEGLETVRGPFVAATAGTGSSLLADPAFCEKVLRRFVIAGEQLDAIALADAGTEGRFDFRALRSDDGPAEPVAHTVIWRRSFERDLPHGLHADPEAPIASLARLLSGAGAQLEWRHLPFPEAAQGEPESPPSNWVQMPQDPAIAADPHHLRPAPEPLLPGAGEYEVARWELTPSWVPPLSTVAIRYRERIGERRLVIGGRPPANFNLEHFLGSLRSTSPQGTRKLVQAEGTYRAVPREDWDSIPADALEIGYVEEAPLPGFDSLALAVHRSSGEHILVTLPDDPLLPAVDVIEHLGFMDAFPLRPRETAAAARPLGLVGLTKAIDYRGRRHRYAIGANPAGRPQAEVGGLAESALQGSTPVWIADDYLVTSKYRPPMSKPGAVAAARWTVEPALWRGIAPPSSRLRAVTRRSARSVASRVQLGRGSVDPSGDPSGWIFDSARPGLAPLYAAHHSVTGDQLLADSETEIARLGYVDVQLLGFMSPAAPPPRKGPDPGPQLVPWARRAGLEGQPR